MNQIHAIFFTAHAKFRQNNHLLYVFQLTPVVLIEKVVAKQELWTVLEGALCILGVFSGNERLDLV